jgi:hypothetical protein
MNNEFRRQRAATVRALAERADPFTKKRLLDLASRYEKDPRPATAIPIPTFVVDARDTEIMD